MELVKQLRAAEAEALQARLDRYEKEQEERRQERALERQRRRHELQLERGRAEVWLEGFRREATVSDLCRREGISPATYYSWTGRSSTR